MISPNLSASRARSFDEILNDLSAGTTPAASSGGRSFSPTFGPDWLSSLLGKTAAAAPASANLDALFGDADEGPSQAQAPEAKAPETNRPEVNPRDSKVEAPSAPPNFDLDERSIATELGLAKARSTADLAKARRAFAKRNHPDLFHAGLRVKATARMQLANMLLDRRGKEIEARR